jgi:hypothetical protein
METFIPFEERGQLWKDIKPVPQFSDNVEILKIDYNREADELNSYFRAILQKGEISKRAYDLTTEIINVIKFNIAICY